MAFKVKELEVMLANAKQEVAIADKAMWEERAARLKAETAEKETHEQFADLKKRLHNAEMEVARLTGYISRVREDDTVREELVTIGDPEGEQRMVPKRKHEYLGNREPDISMSHMMGKYDRYGERKKPKHWIEY